MNKKLNITLLTLAGMLLIGWTATFYFRPAGVTSTCMQDEDIDEATRQTLELVSRKFLTNFISGDAAGAYRLMTIALQQNITKDQISKFQFPASAGKPEDIVALQHTYFIQLGDDGKKAPTMVCAPRHTIHQDQTTVDVMNTPRQAYMLLDANLPSGAIGFTLWLVPEDNTWKVNAFWEMQDTLGGWGPKMFLEKAQAEAQANRSFNAGIYLRTAVQLADRGPNVRLPITDEIEAAAKNINVAAEISGELPFFWNTGTHVYKILEVAPILQQGKLLLSIKYESDAWYSQHQVEGWNKDINDYVKQQFPEYAHAFAGIVVRSYEKGSERSFGTVEYNDKGPN